MRYEWAKGNVIVQSADGLGSEIARADLPWYRQRARVIVAGSTYDFHRAANWSRSLVGELNGQVVMTADPTRWWRVVWQVRTPSGTHDLTRRGFLSDRLTLTLGGAEIARLVRTGSWSQRGAMEAAGPMDAPTVAFLLWVARLQWRRENSG